jgi:serine/threonine-protein kinase
MLTGRPPFAPTKDKYQKLQRYRYENVAPIQSAEINGPTSIIKLIEKMMSFNPELRYQSPAHLLEGIRRVRSELDVKEKEQLEVGKPGPTTVYVVEREEALQDKIRKKFKGAGYRVLITSEPSRAIEQFTRQPYSAIIVDAGTTYRDGLDAFLAVIQRARTKAIPCIGILLLNEEQRDYAAEIGSDKRVIVMHRPLRLGQVLEKLKALLPAPPQKQELKS